MGKAEDEIEKKLKQLELSIKDDEKSKPPATRDKSSGLTADSLESRYNEKKDAEESVAADLYTLGGGALLLVSLLMLFSHMRVGTPFLHGIFGIGNHVGFLLIPLFIGIGMLFYNFKSKTAQIVTGCCLALLLFSLLGQLVMTFPMVSMIELLVMVVPLIAGVAFLAKARQAKLAAIEDRSNKKD